MKVYKFFKHTKAGKISWHSVQYLFGDKSAGGEYRCLGESYATALSGYCGWNQALILSIDLGGSVNAETRTENRDRIFKIFEIFGIFTTIFGIFDYKKSEPWQGYDVKGQHKADVPYLLEDLVRAALLFGRDGHLSTFVTPQICVDKVVL